MVERFLDRRPGLVGEELLPAVRCSSETSAGLGSMPPARRPGGSLGPGSGPAPEPPPIGRISSNRLIRSVPDRWIKPATSLVAEPDLAPARLTA